MKYATDFHDWAFEQARKLRDGEPVDVENIAEELEGLGKSIEQQLESRLIILIVHWLKWEFQPAKQSKSWRATIREQQRRIARLVIKNPSLQPLVPDAVIEAYAVAVIQAALETGLVEADFPGQCPYDYAELMCEVPTLAEEL
jgi:hypothetical protein